MIKKCRECKVEFSTVAGKEGNTLYCTLHRIPPYRRWQLKNKKTIRKQSRKYRIKNLEACRERGRISQKNINNRERFGGNRLKVLERDGHKCRKCGKDVSGKYMANIHHIDHNKKNNLMKNLITICKSCHAKHHYGDRSLSKKGIFIK